MRLFLEKIIKKAEGESFCFDAWWKTFLALIVFRVFLEEIINGFRRASLFEFMVFFGHTLSFFLLAYVIFLLLLQKILKERFFRIANVLLWGFAIILFPPLLDKLFFGNQFIWSFYLFADFNNLIRNFWLFFGDNLRIGVTLGTRIEILGAILGLATYVFIKTKQKKWFFFGLGLFYLIFYLLGSFPSWVVLLLETVKGGSVWAFSERDIVGRFLTPFSFFGFGERSGSMFFAWKMIIIYNFLLVLALVWWQFQKSRKKFLALLKNVRFPQMVFNSGVLFIGLGLGWRAFPEKLTLDFFSILAIINLWIAVFSAWFFSVLVNDEEDLASDLVTNPQRPLPQKIFSLEEYRQYRVVFFFFSIFFPFLIDWKLAFLFLVYHGLTFLYSCPPFRWKRFLGLASLMASLASLLFLLVGFLLFSPGQKLNFFPWALVGFLFLSYFLTIPSKDLKDLLGDKQAGVWTLPVLVGEKRARLILASLFLFGYLFSVYFFREENLFLPAVVLGGGTFWMVTNEKINNRFLPGWVMGLVLVYSLFLLKELFN